MKTLAIDQLRKVTGGGDAARTARYAGSLAAAPFTTAVGAGYKAAGVPGAVVTGAMGAAVAVGSLPATLGVGALYDISGQVSGQPETAIDHRALMKGRWGR